MHMVNHQKQFIRYFIVSCKQPKLVASLINIVQANSEAPRGYIDNITKEAVLVKGTNDQMKTFMFEQGL